MEFLSRLLSYIARYLGTILSTVISCILASVPLYLQLKAGAEFWIAFSIFLQLVIPFIVFGLIYDLVVPELSYPRNFSIRSGLYWSIAIPVYRLLIDFIDFI